MKTVVLMQRTTLLSVAVLLTLTGCGFGLGDDLARADEPQVAFADDAPGWSDVSSGRYRPSAPDASDLEADLHGLYLAPPDRALVRVTVRAETEGSREAAGQRVREVAASVRDALGQGEPCRAQVIDYSGLRRSGDTWSGDATLRYDVDLRGLEDAGARFERLEACMRRFGALDAGGASDVRVSAPIVTVDDPDAHREALLRRAAEGRRAVEAMDALPGAPAARTCYSRGDVTLGRRSLRGVALQLDLECPSTPPGAAAPGALAASPGIVDGTL